jgi:hypothetical protein
MSTVYRKTEKGQTEIETRAFRLLPRLRQALILVDGKRSDAELAKLILAEPEVTLATLLADGFIEATGLAVDIPIPAAPATVPQGAIPAASAAGAAPRRPAASLDVLRREAVRFLNDKLGPAAEGIAMKLERAKTMPEVQPLLVSAAQLVRNVSGKAAADEFVARFLSEGP